MSEALIIGGVTIDRVATGITIVRCAVYAKDGLPSFIFARRGLKLSDFAPDPYCGKTITYTLPSGTMIFAGDVQSFATHPQFSQNGLGWVREWSCTGLLKRAEYIPVTDSNSLTDTARYNLPGDDPNVIPAREGRTIGEITAEVLEMPANHAALQAAGLCNFTSAGVGALAHSVLTGHAVTSAVVDVPGTGYTAVPAVIFSGGGGTGATATATISGGHVTGITIVTGGINYNSPPQTIISTLPAATITDLSNLGVIPFGECDVTGEQILQTLTSCIQNYHPNHWPHFLPDGTLRFYDSRAFSPLTLTLGPADRVAMPQLSRDVSGCYQRVVVRGGTLVKAVNEGLLPAPGSSRPDNGLQEDFGHDGLTNSQAKAAATAADFQQPGLGAGTASATATLSSGTLSTVSPGSQGYGYTSAPTVTVRGGGGSGATATAHLTGDKVTSYTVGAVGSAYTSVPSIVVGPPGALGSYDQGTCTCPSTSTVTVTSVNATFKWASNYWDQTDSGHHGVIILESDIVTGIAQKQQARIVSNTALTAGGTSTLTLDIPLPSTNYTSYQIFGQSGGADQVGRKYKLSDAAQGAALQPYFPFPMAMRFADGAAATLTSTPTAQIMRSGAGDGNPPYVSVSMGMQINPTTGHILLNKCAALVFSPDGTTLVWPDDVQAFLAIAAGTNTAVYPPDVLGVPQYAGTSFSVDGLQRTKTITVNNWRDYSNQANMLLFATETHGALSGAVIEGTVVYHGLLTSVLTPGVSIDVTGDTYTTGLESAAIPCLGVEIDFNEGAEGTTYTTTLHLSTRRAPYSAAIFQRPSQQPGGAFLGGYGGGLDLGGYQTGGSTQSALETGLNFGANAVQGMANDAANIPTNPDVFLPSQQDFANVGVDVTAPPPKPTMERRKQFAADMDALDAPIGGGFGEAGAGAGAEP